MPPAGRFRVKILTALVGSFDEKKDKRSHASETLTEILARWTVCTGKFSIVIKVHNTPMRTTTEYTECWPCPLFDILLNKYYPAG
jgi:hypothetical protein